MNHFITMKKIPTIIEKHMEVKTAKELIDILSMFPPDTHVHGAFEDPININIIFHPQFGIKTISIED
jgi:hypothetical protein